MSSSTLARRAAACSYISRAEMAEMLGAPIGKPVARDFPSLAQGEQGDAQGGGQVGLGRQLGAGGQLAGADAPVQLLIGAARLRPVEALRRA